MISGLFYVQQCSKHIADAGIHFLSTLQQQQQHAYRSNLHNFRSNDSRKTSRHCGLRLRQEVHRESRQSGRKKYKHCINKDENNFI